MATESPLITTNFPRHQVCDWACELAPGASRPLLMKGEALLDQPLAGHEEAEAEPVLRSALRRHRQRLRAAGLSPVAAHSEGDDEGSFFGPGALGRRVGRHSQSTRGDDDDDDDGGGGDGGGDGGGVGEADGDQEVPDGH